MALAGFRGFPVYTIAEVLIWLAVDAPGIHPTVTGVVLGLMTPVRRWVDDERLYGIVSQVVAHPSRGEGSGKTRGRQTLRLAETAARETLSPVERLAMGLHPWVDFIIMPLFALTNAGLTLSSADPRSTVTMAVFAGLAVGKPIGVVTFGWLAVRSRLAALPPDLDWAHLAGGGFLAGIGFTMASFVANLAFEPDVLGSAKLGILLASIVSAVLGLLALRSRPPPSTAAHVSGQS